MVEPKSKSGSERQREYTQRMKDKGYVQLSSIWCPAAYRDQLRIDIANLIEAWEKQAKFEF